MGITSLRRHYDDSQPEEVMEGTTPVEAVLGLNIDGAETPVVEQKDPGAHVPGPSITQDRIDAYDPSGEIGVTKAEDLGAKPQDDAETVETAEAKVEREQAEQAEADALAAQAAAESEDATGGSTEPKAALPAGNASLDSWRAYALDANGGGATEEDIEGLGRDDLRDRYSS